MNNQNTPVKKKKTKTKLKKSDKGLKAVDKTEVTIEIEEKNIDRKFTPPKIQSKSTKKKEPKT